MMDDTGGAVLMVEVEVVVVVSVVDDMPLLMLLKGGE